VFLTRRNNIATIGIGDNAQPCHSRSGKADHFPEMVTGVLVTPGIIKFSIIEYNHK
jgi:hypothetical protein